jgi:hypothetical protein
MYPATSFHNFASRDSILSNRPQLGTGRTTEVREGNEHLPPSHPRIRVQNLTLSIELISGKKRSINGRQCLLTLASTKSRSIC